jgi:hypothetical protein
MMFIPRNIDFFPRLVAPASLLDHAVHGVEANREQIGLRLDVNEGRACVQKRSAWKRGPGSPVDS